MSKTEPQSLTQNETAPAQGLEPVDLAGSVRAPSSETPQTPAHPAANDWATNRKLEKLEQDYRCDQERRPAEIKSL
jgi:hypothetical protein